jgi:VWFA-related protein
MQFSGTGVATIGVAAIAIGLSWGWHSVAAQQNSGATTTLQMYSKLTVVDVTATDADGQPIYGLLQSDFKILEDGNPQPIQNFEEVGLRPVIPTREMPPNVYTNLQPAAPSSAVNILLLDFANMAPEDWTDARQLSQSTNLQKRVKDAAMQAFQQMPLGTRVAVISMTNTLRVLQSFSSNRALLTAAINAAPPFDLEGNGDKQCVQSNNRNRMVLEALEQVAVSSATIKGRKNLIWFTVGIPAITDPSSRPECLPDYSRELSQAYDLLTAAQVSVYPIDAIGVDRLGERQLSENSVAQATGGLAYSATNDMASAVLKAIDNGANYYSIAYVPPREKFDGAYHKIDVTVDRPRVNVVFRKGYYADDLTKYKLPPGLTLSLTPPPAYAGNMKAPMSRGLSTSEQILFDVGVEPSTVAQKPGDPPVLGTLDAKLKGKRLTRYGFQYTVPAQQITFTNAPDQTHKSALDFDIAVYDSEDKLLTGLSQIVKIPLSDGRYQQMLAGKEPIRFFQQIDLPPGQLFIRVGVLDRTSNKVGTLELPLKVGKY